MYIVHRITLRLEMDFVSKMIYLLGHPKSVLLWRSPIYTVPEQDCPFVNRCNYDNQCLSKDVNISTKSNLGPISEVPKAIYKYVDSCQLANITPCHFAD